MNYTFFHILAIDPELGTERLNHFLQQHPIHSIERQFVAEGANSFWSICVVTHGKNGVESTITKTSSNKRKGVDYQAVLSPEHFTIFAQLREYRNIIAKEHDVAPYAVFTNEQLSKISQLETINIKSMAHLKGIGGKRLEVYAVALLEKLLNKDSLDNG